MGDPHGLGRRLQRQSLVVDNAAGPHPQARLSRCALNAHPGGTVYTATVTVIDALGHTGSASRIEPVADVAPVLTSAPITLPANFNGQVTLAAFTDASVGPWHVVIDGGSGFQSDQWLVAPGPIQVPYDAHFGNRTFTVSVTDRRGLRSTPPAQVQIAAP